MSQLVRFGAAEDDQLIKMVCGHPILWELKNSEYKNAAKKELIWTEIGKRINKTKDESQKRWKSIRDHYRRQTKEGSLTGSAAKKKRATYWDRLNFLDSLEDERQGFSIASSGFVEESASQETRNETEAVIKCEVISDAEHSGSDPYFHAPQMQSPPPQSRPNPQPSSSATFQPPPSKNRLENSEFLKYLSEQTEDRTSLITCVEELVKQAPPEDEIDMFFKTMAMTVKKFPPAQATQTKLKIFQTVSDMEIELQQQSTRRKKPASRKIRLKRKGP